MDGRRGPVFHAGEMRKIPAEGQQKLRLKKRPHLLPNTQSTTVGELQTHYPG